MPSVPALHNPAAAAPAVALLAPPAPGGRVVDAPACRAGLLAQALRDHHDQPDADHAARVLACLHEAFSAAGNGSEGFELPALQARLGPADALVAYGRQGEELLACVVRTAGVEVFRRLARWHDVRAAWRLARFQLDALCHGAGPPPDHWPTLLKRAQLRLQGLHRLVWAPFSDALTDARRVLLVPGAGLAGLPFAALLDGLTWVAQRHLLAEVPSLALALRGLSPSATPTAEPSTAAAACDTEPGVVLLGLGDDDLRGAANLACRVPALLASGRSRVLACRWPVGEAVTAAFVDRFHRERLLGRGPSEALSEARAGLMVNHPHPAFWAGFVLYGGW